MTARTWLGLESGDALVPCECKPLWKRIVRHIGDRNRPLRKYKERWSA